ncbi:hypothetical protein I4U23_015351 [Adineta vaga]|nr:hypothetical protein I4U23_015351 [Adineta vaga]
METNDVVLHKLNLCKDSQYTNSQLFIAIKSSTKNFHQRQLVRQTWLPEVLQYHIPYVFVLRSTDDGELLDKLLKEDKQYHDLIMGKFVDDYYNLTLKSIFTLTWTKFYCPTRWLLYTDDDAIINIENIVRFITSIDDLSNPNLFCHKCSRKWYVPPNTLHLLQKISTDNETKPKLWLEDVFVTGITAQAAGIKAISLPFVCCRRRKRLLFEKSLTLGEMGKNKEFIESWKMVRNNSIHRHKQEFNSSIFKK